MVGTTARCHVPLAIRTEVPAQCSVYRATGGAPLQSDPTERGRVNVMADKHETVGVAGGQDVGDVLGAVGDRFPAKRAAACDRDDIAREAVGRGELCRDDRDSPTSPAE